VYSQAITFEQTRYSYEHTRGHIRFHIETVNRIHIELNIALDSLPCHGLWSLCGHFALRVFCFLFYSIFINLPEASERDPVLFLLWSTRWLAI